MKRWGEWTVEHPDGFIISASVALPDGIHPDEGVPGLEEWTIGVVLYEKPKAIEHLNRYQIKTLRNFLTAILADTEED
jgi:hypothetical protein